jgi:hypothetical protein
VTNDRNDISDDGELMTLADAGITSISLTRTPSGARDRGNAIGNVGTVARADSTTATIQSVYFATDSHDTRDPRPTGFTVSAEAALFSHLPSLGQIRSAAYTASTNAACLTALTTLADGGASVSDLAVNSNGQSQRTTMPT